MSGFKSGVCFCVDCEGGRGCREFIRRDADYAMALALDDEANVGVDDVSSDYAIAFCITSGDGADTRTDEDASLALAMGFEEKHKQELADGEMAKRLARR